MTDIWEEGTDLSDAVEVFAREEAKTRLEAMRLAFEHPTKALELAKSINDEALVAAITKHQTISEKYKNYLPMQALQAVGSIASKSGGSKALEDDILTQIQQKKLIGFGYILPREVGDRPTQVPQDVWLGNIGWGTNSVCGNGLDFVSVRLVAASGAGETDIMSAVNMAMPSPGRPSKKNLVLEAFEYGLQRDLFDFNESNAATYQKVRGIIQKFFPDEYEDGKGLQDGAMQKHLSKRIDSERTSEAISDLKPSL